MRIISCPDIFIGVYIAFVYFFVKTTFDMPTHNANGLRTMLTITMNPVWSTPLTSYQKVQQREQPSTLLELPPSSSASCLPCSLVGCTESWPRCWSSRLHLLPVVCLEVLWAVQRAGLGGSNFKSLLTASRLGSNVTSGSPVHHVPCTRGTGDF